MKFPFVRPSFRDFAIATGVLALSGVLCAQNAKNPIEVALLRWYQVNTAVQLSTCSPPSVLGFDGKHIWVACGNVSELHEYNSSDGSPIAAITSVFVSGVLFSSLLYDGENIWVSGNSNTAGFVTRINVSTVNGDAACVAGGGGCNCTSLGNACASVSNVLSGAGGMTFDGANVWVANGGANNLSRITANAQPPIAATTVTLNSACNQPLFLAFDGTNVLVPCRNSNSVQFVTLTQQSLLTGITSPAWITYDGTDIWVTSTNGTVYEVSPSGSGHIVSSAKGITGGAGGGSAYDGKYLWVADYSTAMVTKLQLGGPITSSGSAPNITSMTAFSGGLTNPESPVFDGANVWFANSGGTTVSKF